MNSGGLLYDMWTTKRKEPENNLNTKRWHSHAILNCYSIEFMNAEINVIECIHV